MLSFFFNRHSKMVSIMEVIGAILFSAATIKAVTQRPSPPVIVLFLFILAEYAFLKICTIRRWYDNVPRWSGVELHFKKAMVPTDYIMALFGAFALVFPSAWVLGTAAFLLTIVAHVNIILIYLHLQDRDKTPPNFYSSGRLWKGVGVSLRLAARETAIGSPSEAPKPQKPPPPSLFQS